MIYFKLLGVLLFLSLFITPIVYGIYALIKFGLLNQREPTEINTNESNDPVEIKNIEQQKPQIPYKICTSMLTDHELSFYKKLRPIAERNGYTVMVKVRLADIVTIPQETPNYMKWFNLVKAKHIDFVVCTLNAEPRFAIELDDYTHDWESTKKRDEIKNQIFSNQKVKLLRYRNYTVEQLMSDMSFL